MGQSAQERPEAAVAGQSRAPSATDVAEGARGEALLRTNESVPWTRAQSAVQEGQRSDAERERPHTEDCSDEQHNLHDNAEEKGESSLSEHLRQRTRCVVLSESRNEIVTPVAVRNAAHLVWKCFEANGYLLRN